MATMIDDESSNVGGLDRNVRTLVTIVCCKVVKQTIVRKDRSLVFRVRKRSFSEKKKNRNGMNIHVVPVVQNV